MANLFIISAPSGCGKTSLIKALIKNMKKLSVAVSYTTRMPRPDETHTESYFFISESEFKAMQDKGDFIESAKVFNHYYGSAKSSVEFLINKGYDTILEIDWQGARQIKSSFPDAVGIFILPPSKTVLKSRLANREQDMQSIINQRMRGAVSEMQHFDEFDYLVINDDFYSALQNLSDIINAQRLTLAQQKHKHLNLLKMLI